MISVIGAGPVGSFSAFHAIKEHEVTLFESQNITERKVQCAGLVSKSGIKRLGISPPSKVILNQVRGAKFFPPSKKEVVIDGKKPKAYVLDRKEFDNFLLDKAIASGVNFVNEKVDVKKLNLLQKKSARIILATGTNYQLQKKLNLELPKKFLSGIQYEMELKCDPDFVELHFNVPGFFSWVIPYEDYARVGICSYQNSQLYLEKFLKELRKAGRISSEKILGKSSGVIPLYQPKIKTQYPKMVTVGDAASQVKATTGGGIVMGCLAAKFSSQKNYEKSWRNEIGKELSLHLKIREFLNKLSPENLDNFFEIIQKNKKIIEEQGDMDLAYPLFFALLKNPKFLTNFISKTPLFLRDLL